MIGRVPQIATSWSITGGGRLTETPLASPEEKQVARQVSSTTKASSRPRSAARILVTKGIRGHDCEMVRLRRSQTSYSNEIITILA